MKRIAVLPIVLILFYLCSTHTVIAQEHLSDDPFIPYLSSVPEKVDRMSVEKGVTVGVEKGAAAAVEKITFSSRKGLNTIYGIVGSPVAAGKYPALLVFHGGSSCADEVAGYVRRYAALGYVAMCIDLPGICNPAKAAFSEGPWKSRPAGNRDARFDLSKGIDSSTLVDAVAAALQAFNLLGSFVNVDKQHMGVTGFSWGGYMTTMLAGLLGDRVSAAYSVFGCGFYEKGSNWKDTLSAMPAALRTSWLNYFDAGRRAGGIKCPYFIEESSNDKFFWPAAVMATLDAVSSEKGVAGRKGVVWGPNLNHTRLSGGDEMQQFYFDHYLKGLGKPFCTVGVKPDGAGSIVVDVIRPEGVSVDSILLYYSEKTAPGVARIWKVKAAPSAGGPSMKIALPAGQINYFVSIVDSRKVRVSSYMQGVSFSTLRLPALVGDNMILQRDIALPIWGWAAPGVVVEIVFRGKTYHTITGADGKWLLRLDKLPAGGPYEMTISGDGASRTLKNILIGDVWLCSGQSNMAYSFSGARAKKYYSAEIDSAGNDQIRQLLVTPATSPAPAGDVSSSGWLSVARVNMPSFSIVAYFFAKDLYERYHIPIGIINSSYGGTTAEGWTSEEALKPFPQWNDRTALTDSTIGGRKFRPQDMPSYLYNAMIAPLIPYALKGVLWYQGENNGGKGFDYRRIFPNMIKDWRLRWGQGNFPFVYEQLVNWKMPIDHPAESDWAELREAQTMTLSVAPNTGMAVGIELGEADDIHPINKKDIADRLFLVALDKAYGWHEKGGEGPFYRKMTISGGRVLLDFDTYGSRLVAKGGELHYFAIAGQDKKFVWAKAQIKNKHTVEVWNEQVPMPVAVRYGWADNPEGCNLYNAKGLPASPFRTDDWHRAER